MRPDAVHTRGSVQLTSEADKTKVSRSSQSSGGVPGTETLSPKASRLIE
jgi:hypothetical protein